MDPIGPKDTWLGHLAWKHRQLIFDFVENSHQLDRVKRALAFLSIPSPADGLRCSEWLGPVALSWFLLRLLRAGFAF